jgi:hypothetical protein
MGRAPRKTTSTSVFGNAPVVVVDDTDRTEKAPRKPVLGMQNLAAIHAVILALEAVRARLREEVELIVRNEHIREGMEIDARPKTFIGFEGIGEASCQLNKSAARYSEEALALFRQYELPMTSKQRSNVPETYIIGEEYARDSEFIHRLEAECGPALQRLADKRGPIVRRQVPVMATRLTDEAYDQIFQFDDVLVVEQLVAAAMTLSIGLKLNTGGDIRPALPLVEEVLRSPLWTDLVKTTIEEPEKKPAKRSKAA